MMLALNEGNLARAFGGGYALEGNMRFVYLDESGISLNEPYVVVCGVIIDGDKQLISVEDYLELLVNKHIPQRDRDGFVFHATNILSGTKYFKCRTTWPLERRLEILDDLVKIPAKFDLPIALGFVIRKRFPYYPLNREPTKEELAVGAHAVAFAACTMEIERTMRQALPDEVALLIAENNREARTAIKEAHAMYRNETELERNGIQIDCFPLKKIRDTVHFAEKSECRHLQLADVCAFVVRGHLTRHRLSNRFYPVLKPYLLSHPKEEARLPI